VALFVTYLRLGGLEPLVEGPAPRSTTPSRCCPTAGSPCWGRKNGPDRKYGYQECLLLDYRLTGDERMPEASKRVLKLLDIWDPAYSPEHTFWTERYLGLSLFNAVGAYEMWRDDRLLARAWTIFEAVLHPPAGASKDGCLMHTGRQHGERVDGWYAACGCLRWMSSLVVDVMLRYYLVSADPRVPGAIEKLADFMVRTGSYRLRPYANEPSDLTFPDDLVRSQTLAQAEADPWSDRRHALDSALILAAADYFSRQAG